MGIFTRAKTFNIKDDLVALRGMLPEMSKDSSERVVRAQIRDTLKNFDETYEKCLLSDFEFLEASGKKLCVPAQPPDFQWTGQAVKQLNGSGSVYLRLTTNFSDFVSSGSQDMNLKSRF